MVTSDHLAVVFDFDDTLVPDSTSLFLKSKGFDVEAFWGRDVKRLVETGFDSPLAYLQLMLDEVRNGRLEGLRRVDLRLFGKTLDDKYFSGLPQMFLDLKSIISDYRDVTLEFYIISSGIQDIIEGSQVVRDHFSAVYGCRLSEDPDTGVIDKIQRCVTFTEKTRYLFEINKGILQADSVKNPGLVNQAVNDEDRRIPLENMIYVGDGLTDIPCFSLVRKGGGVSFGVFDPARRGSARQALEQFLNAGRTVSSHHPKYGPADELGELLRVAVLSMASRRVVGRQQT